MAYTQSLNRSLYHVKYITGVFHDDDVILHAANLLQSFMALCQWCIIMPCPPGTMFSYDVTLQLCTLVAKLFFIFTNHHNGNIPEVNSNRGLFTLKMY